jgi:hypothetical protein
VFLMTAFAFARGDAHSPSQPALDQVLSRSGEYVRQLHAQLSGIVSEETYTQELRSKLDSSFQVPLPSRRLLKSDLLLVKPARENRYVEYRDVYEVDGAAVRDRQERLTALFLAPGANSGRQLATIIEESARYNIGDIPRNINTPMLTVSFLLPDMQRRFRFRVARETQPQLARPGGAGEESVRFRTTTEMWAIAFREISRPTVIRTNNHRDFPAAG